MTVQLILDSRTLRLRDVCSIDTPVILHENRVELPRYRIMDLNCDTALVCKYDGDLPPNWRQVPHRYDVENKRFIRDGYV